MFHPHYKITFPDKVWRGYSILSKFILSFDKKEEIMCDKYYKETRSYTDDENEYEINEVVYDRGDGSIDYVEQTKKMDTKLDIALNTQTALSIIMEFIATKPMIMITIMIRIIITTTIITMMIIMTMMIKLIHNL